MAERAFNPRTCAYLSALGVDVNRVPVGGWDRDGYDEIQGEGPYGDDASGRLRRTWPVGFDYAELLEHWAADEPTRRPAGEGI